MRNQLNLPGQLGKMQLHMGQMYWISFQLSELSQLSTFAIEAAVSCKIVPHRDQHTPNTKQKK
jgi:hypothetical protein